MVPKEAPPALPSVETSQPASHLPIERGRPNWFLDGTGRVLGLPDALLLWNWRVNNHHISPKTEQMVVDYLSEYDLPDVMVRVNEYAPFSEWSRLTKNRQIGAGWRYTVGVMDMLMYTFLPGRLIGDDWYNPFTNTINLYSDVPAIAVHEAAYAKDIHRRRNPGTYATLQHLPIVGMWYRTNATLDALQYIKRRGGPEEFQEADRVLYPMYGRAAGGQIGMFIPIPFAGNALDAAGALVGHAAALIFGHHGRSKPEDGDGSEALPPAATAAIRWRADYAAAQDEARLKNRPLLLEFRREECFWCQKLDETTFRTPELAGLIDQDFIPVKIDASRDSSITRALNIQRFPTLILATPSGEVLEILEGYMDALTLAQHLRQAVKSVGGDKQ